MSDALGMFMTITLGGLGMFLLVLVFSFLAAQLLVKKREGFGDQEDALLEFDDCRHNNGIVPKEGRGEDQDIFFIRDTEDVMNVKTKYSFQAKGDSNPPVSLLQRLGLKDKVSNKINRQLHEKITKLA